MKILSVIIKSLKEQIRSYWILILTVSLAPVFVFIYYLMVEGYKPHYDLLLLNEDQVTEYLDQKVNYGNLILDIVAKVETDTFDIPLKVKLSDNKQEAIKKLKNRKADALIVIPKDFSKRLVAIRMSSETINLNIEFIGDLTNFDYMVTAVYVNELINEYIFNFLGKSRLLKIKETGIGVSSSIDEFDLYVPGLLIISLIMLMFSATIAIVTEVENQTIIRLKLSGIHSLGLLTGIGIVQILVGLLAILFTLVVAIGLGFNMHGSYLMLIFISVLTSISIIAFCLIIAAITKSANEVLIVGNFPMLLFMFFSGAAFPIKGKTIFTIAQYPISLQGLMSPTHSISAFKKILVMNMEFHDVVPEIIAIIVLTIFYFFIGILAFQKRHMKIV